MSAIVRLNWLVAAALLLAAPAHAALTIQITKGKEGALPIAIVPFAFDAGGPPPPEDVAAVVSANLARSGRFAPIAPDALPGRPSDFAELDFADWRLLGTSHIVIGRVRAIPGGRYSVEFRLVDVLRARQVTGFQVDAAPGDLRRTGHQISDIVYQELTGERGAFDTRIAYITERGRGQARRYELNVADSDGFDARVVLSSRAPLVSPAWSPDGGQLAYVSFEAERAEIFVQDVTSGKRRRLTSFPGLNSAPAFAPDGRRLALTLSKDGNPEIYVQDLASGRLRRLTVNGAIDTEPDWSPDGAWIAFTSNRGGSPQVYRVPADGSAPPERISFEGSYNARPRYSPDGTRLATVYGEGSLFRIAVLDLETRALQVLTDTYLDESPSFAPNGSMILYATSTGQGSALAAVSTDGAVQQTLVERRGVAREPAWSPFRTR